MQRSPSTTFIFPLPETLSPVCHHVFRESVAPGHGQFCCSHSCCPRRVVACRLPRLRQNAAEIDQQESTLILPTFTSQTAYALGTSIRSLIQKTHPGSPAVIAIFAGSTSQLYFFATAAEGTQPDNMEWVERKRRSVVRWMKSTAALRCKFGSNGPPAQYGTPEEVS